MSTTKTYTKEEILKIVKDENVKFIKLMFVDINGAPKSIDISYLALDRALDGKIMFDGSSILGMTTQEDSDLALKPDYSSFRRLPMYDSHLGAVAALFCDIDCDGCTRSNLRKQLEEMKKLGFDTMNVGFESEFFVLRARPTKTIEPAHLLDNGTYADAITPLFLYEIMSEIEKVGMVPATAHHERAPSGFEVTYDYADAITACDNLILFRLIARDVANRHNLHITFMPKPMTGENGNGMHTHISLAKKGENKFSAKEPLNYSSDIMQKIGGASLSTTALSFIAGILEHAKPLCFLCNPIINSYRRLNTPGHEAPTSVTWGYKNRDSMIRIPKAKGSSTRIEVRNPDNTCNPYLAITGLLASGLDGIRRKLKPKTDSTEVPETLPLILREAIEEFKNSDLMKAVIPAHTFGELIRIKKEEISVFNKITSSTAFDIEHYF